MLAERREVLGGLLTVVGGTCCGGHAMAQTSGCWVPRGQAQPYFNRVQGRTTMFIPDANGLSRVPETSSWIALWPRR